MVHGHTHKYVHVFTCLRYNFDPDKAARDAQQESGGDRRADQCGVCQNAGKTELLRDHWAEKKIYQIISCQICQKKHTHHTDVN